MSRPHFIFVHWRAPICPWLTNRRLFPESTPLYSGTAGYKIRIQHCRVQNKNPALPGTRIRHYQVQNKNPAMNDVTAGYHIKVANSYYILPVRSSRQDGTKVWLPGKHFFRGINCFLEIVFDKMENTTLFHGLGSFQTLQWSIYVQCVKANSLPLYKNSYCPNVVFFCQFCFAYAISRMFRRIPTQKFFGRFNSWQSRSLEPMKG